jgi:RNA polymerase sigma factor (sigma-70 family)
MATINDRNRQIIGETYTRIRQEIFSIFRQACIAEDDCEDLVQEVFLKIMGLDIIIEDQLKGMAVKMAYQKRIDYLRHRACKNKVHDDLAWQLERSYTCEEAEVHDIMHIEMKAIKCMSDKDAEVYQMTRFEEKTAEEIALELQMTRRAVESRIYRTRIMVRHQVRQAIGFE